ncbi:MAG: (d)CMP kinase [Candidatus Omnitrophota bacterium]|nr:(d)CMP kinase [Candidatus Omnitrophota bacterium]
MTEDKNFVVAIDGPAGSGKSTVAKLIAKKLKLLYIDTGAMYRALTFAALSNNVNPLDNSSVTKLAKKCRIELEDTPAGLRVSLNSIDVTCEIRSPKVNSHVSDVAKIKEVREIMVKEQRRLASGKGVVLEGRDIGTVVFPDARYKFYLDASVNERAKRRVKEMPGAKPNDVKANVLLRDKIDSSREIGPLKKAQDAVYVDTTDMTIEEVVDTILKKINVTRCT